MERLIPKTACHRSNIIAGTDARQAIDEQCERHSRTGGILHSSGHMVGPSSSSMDFLTCVTRIPSEKPP